MGQDVSYLVAIWSVSPFLLRAWGLLLETQCMGHSKIDGPVCSEQPKSDLTSANLRHVKYIKTHRLACHWGGVLLFDFEAVNFTCILGGLAAGRPH